VSSSVVEEDSGIPFRAFGKGEWDFTCFGKYVAPRDPFERWYQKDLDKACTELPAHPLPFMIGYRKLNDTFLLVAAKKDAAVATAAPASAPDAAPAPATAPLPPPPVPVAPAHAATNTVAPPIPAPAPSAPPAR
jgi:hypothetical protein